jgi:hypothetical protein
LSYLPKLRRHSVCTDTWLCSLLDVASILVLATCGQVCFMVLRTWDAYDFAYCRASRFCPWFGLHCYTAKSGPLPDRLAWTCPMDVSCCAFALCGAFIAGAFRLWRTVSLQPSSNCHRAGLVRGAERGCCASPRRSEHEALQPGDRMPRCSASGSPGR